MAGRKSAGRSFAVVGCLPPRDRLCELMIPPVFAFARKFLQNSRNRFLRLLRLLCVTDPASGAGGNDASRRFARSLLPRLLLAALVFPSAGGAEAPRVRFDLPAGKAETSLKLLSQQSGVEVLFPTDAVAGVRTNHVQGEMTALQALNAMLIGTSLVAIEGKSTASLTVKRKGPASDSEKNVGRTDQPSASDRSRDLLKKNKTETPKIQEPMKRNKFLTKLAVALSLFFTPATQAADDSGTITGRVSNVATGTYLNNARISIKGTDREVFTDAFGTYRLVGVPGGAITLEVFYTDLDPQEIPMTVAPGESIERNIDMTSQSRYGQNQEVMKLDPFLVSSDQETDSQSIALNEQRFAPNIKNVMAADSFGDVLGSSVGEFLKFLPGIALEENGNEVQGVSIRGAGGSKTAYTTDGSPLATANDGASRNVDLVMLALDSISRLEVTKVPTPSTPADSLSGSVNMVSKSAFERSKAQLNYGINLIGNGEHLTLKKTPQSVGDRKDFKTLPGFNFSYALPIKKTFGIIVTGVHSDKYSDTAIATKVFNAAGAQTGASISNPYLRQFTLAHSPKNLSRTSFTFKADWRVTPHSVLSFGAQRNRSESNQGANTWVFNAGTNGAPAVAGGERLNFGEDYTSGATGRGAVTLTSGTVLRRRAIDGLNLSYRYDDGRWKLDAAVNGSNSTRSRVPSLFVATSASLFAAPGISVTMTDIDDVRPGNIRVFDNSNREIDLHDINNYRLNTATELVSDVNRSEIRSGNLNLKRRLSLFSFPSSVQVGGLRNVTSVDSRPENRPLTYAGPDGATTTADTVAPFQTQVFRNQDDHFGFRNAPWYSPDRAWSAYQETPSLFAQTPAQAVSAATAVINNSKRIEETISALYLQAEARLFRNRLNVLTGVRFERTADEGEGGVFDPNAVFLRNPDGSFSRNAAGARIRKPEAGAVGSMEELRLTREERGYKGARAYDGYYPSLHLTYSLKENLLLRAAYARTYARPDFGDIIPTATINENDLTEEDIDNNPELILGTITVSNIALQPWTADNYDLSAEYYFSKGGMVGAGVFLKEIKDFFGTGVRVATVADLEELGLGPQYVNWNLNTKFNSGDARISGAEFDFRQSLRFLGKWGGYFSVFANGTYLRLEGNQRADFTSFVPKSANWGVSFNRKRVQMSARWNYRGVNKRGAQPAFGPDAFAYYPASTRLDLSAAYHVSKRLTVVASVNNVSYVPERTLQYGSETPAYAKYTVFKEYGIAVGLGVKGTF
jgi:iron complex outermembrane receptor protein